MEKFDDMCIRLGTSP